MSTNRAQNLDDKMIESIIQILDGWTGKLTWSLFITAIAEKTGQTYSRQALHGHVVIYDAFKIRKEGLSRTRDKKIKAPENMTAVEVAALMDLNARLEAENQRLRAENERLLERFVVWAYNAHTRDLDEGYLDRPMPAIDREPTKSRKHRKVS